MTWSSFVTGRTNKIVPSVATRSQLVSFLDIMGNIAELFGDLIRRFELVFPIKRAGLNGCRVLDLLGELMNIKI